MPPPLRSPLLVAALAGLIAPCQGCSLFRQNANGAPPQRAANQTEFQLNAQERAFARRDEQIARRQGTLARRAAEEAAQLRDELNPGLRDPSPLTELTLDPNARSASDGPAPTASAERVVDGMVGQVNGQAIYADDIFEPIHAQLRALGRRLPRAQFRQQATQIIAGRLQQLVTDSLIFGEAERDLSENERFGIRQAIELHREELIRRFGRGSVTLANDTLVAEEGVTLDEKVEEFRQSVVVQRYLRQELLPLVNVSRRDIRRYYEDNLDTFQPPQTYTVYFIRDADRDALDAMVARIAGGEETFDQVASTQDPQKGFRPEQFGLFAQNLRLDEISEGTLRDTAAELDDQALSDPFEFNNSWWVMKLDYEEVPEARTLADAQVEIEQQLRAQRFGAESEKFRRELVRTGSYNPIEQMARDLVEIAVTRYSRPTTAP
ncbi:MAG: peptidylprolyl isomerase [Planctomycetota bacterium]